MSTHEITTEAVDFDPFAEGSIERVIETSEAQREIWLADKLSAQASLAYNESISLVLRGPLLASALFEALNALVARHDALRATVSADGMQLLIDAPAPRAFELRDLSALDATAREQAVRAARTEAVETRFELEHGPLLRALLLRCEGELHELVLSAHHIVVDGWSWSQIVEDLGALYARALGRAAALPDAAHYADYVRVTTAQAASPEMEAHTRFWTERFAGPPVPPLDLPLDRARPATRGFASRRIDLQLEPELLQQVRRLGAASGASLFATLFAAFAGLLHRLTHQRDLVIGVPAAGQNASDMPTLVGHCVNLLPMRFAVDPAATMQALIRAASTTSLDAFEHQTMTYGTLLKKLQLPRDPSRPTLVSVMFNLDRKAAPAEGSYPGLAVELVSNPRHFENFELFLNCTPTADGLQFECQYNTGLFDEASVRRWLELLRSALERFAADPQIPLAQAYAPCAADRALLDAFNRTDAPYDAHQRIESLIAAQAAATPEAIAVVAGETRLSYRELDARANALAHALQAQGVRAGQLVGLSCARNEHMLVALLGILKAGAGYVPLDPSFPPERLAFMAQDAGLAVIVTDAPTQALWSERNVRLLRADEAGHADAPPVHDGRAHDVAYVIYTSGSTGRPKGVRVTHRSVLNLLTSLRTVPGMRANHVVLAVTTLSFDISVSEAIMPLTVGARIVVADKAQAGDGELLRALIEREGVDFIDATPSTWRLLLEAGWSGRGDLLAICTGEPLPPDLGRQLLPRVGALWNGYGPTETTVWSSFHRVERIDGPVPIGRPIANTRFHVLDETLQPVPVGVSGELYIAGAGVTLGYLNRPELTDERFLPDPTAAEVAQRWYRTGDLGRWRADGILECQGRVDHQVKVRGYRIELGEIESNLATHPAVAHNHVITREDAPGDVRIVAYVVPRGAVPEAAEFKRHLSAFLPDYMVPQHFVALDALPLLPNGKIDRNALPPPYARAPDAVARPRVEPADDLEREVLTLMEQVLSLPQMSMDDDFFALGGHSLLAARLSSTLARRFEIKLPLATLFEAPTPLRLARAIAQARQNGGAQVATVRIEHRRDQRSAPFTPMQERILFVEELHPGRSVYNVPSGHRLRGPFDRAAFEAALREIVRRQAVLRSVAATDVGSGQSVQHVLERIDVQLPFEDLRAIPADRREAVLIERMQAVADTPMDIHQGPLFRAALYQLDDEEHALAFVPHHLVWDGWSFDVFQSDLAATYGALSQGRPSPLGELPISYGDYASWYAEWLAGPEAQAQLDYWKQRFARARPAPVPRTDMPRGAGMSGRGESCFLRIDKHTTERLRDIARGHDVTLNMLALGVLALMMNTVVGGDAVVIATPVRGRDTPELESVMGFFNNLLALPLEVERTLTLGRFLQRIKLETVASMHHQQIPFERLVAEPEFKQHARGGPLYQALFSFQDARERPQHIGTLRHEQIHLRQRGATDDLGLWLMDKPNGLEGAVNYNAEIYLPETGTAFRDRFEELLRKVARLPDATLDELAEPGDSPAAAHLARLAAGTPAEARGTPARTEFSDGLLMPEQARLAQIWADVLGMDVNDILPTDNFFDLGGDSLLAMRAVQQAEQLLGFRVEARRYLFESLAQLSAAIDPTASAMAAMPPPGNEGEPGGRGLFGRMKSVFGRK